MDLPAIAVVGASAADLFTTELALANGPAYEANPLFRERPVRIAGKALATVVVLHTGYELKRRGKRRAAKVLLWGAAAAWAGAAVWNAIQAKKHLDVPH